MKEHCIGSKLIRRDFDVLAEMADHIIGGFPRVKYQPTQNSFYGMSLKFEGRNDSKVPAPSAKSPKEILVLSSTGREYLAVRGNYLARQKVVDRHPVFAKEPTDTATESKTSNTSLRNYPRRDGETEWICFPIEIS